jgi:ribosome-binding factor A
MAGRRIERLNEQLKRELMEILQLEARDPRIGVVTVTAVETTPDLYFARVHVNSMGTPEEKQTTLEGLAAAASYLRSELGQRLRLRRIPELRFELDLTLEHALRIERLLSEVLPPRTEEGEEIADDGDASE